MFAEFRRRHVIDLFERERHRDGLCANDAGSSIWHVGGARNSNERAIFDRGRKSSCYCDSPASSSRQQQQRVELSLWLRHSCALTPAAWESRRGSLLRAARNTGSRTPSSRAIPSRFAVDNTFEVYSCPEPEKLQYCPLSTSQSGVNMPYKTRFFSNCTFGVFFCLVFPVLATGYPHLVTHAPTRLMAPSGRQHSPNGLGEGGESPAIWRRGSRRHRQADAVVWDLAGAAKDPGDGSDCMKARQHTDLMARKSQSE